MNTSVFKEELIKKMEDLVTGKISFGFFEDDYYNYYHTKVTHVELDDVDMDFFEAINETIEYTDSTLRSSDRLNGIISTKEAIVRIAKALASYRDGSWDEMACNELISRTN